VWKRYRNISSLAASQGFKAINTVALSSIQQILSNIFFIPHSTLKIHGEEYSNANKPSNLNKNGLNIAKQNP